MPRAMVPLLIALSLAAAGCTGSSAKPEPRPSPSESSQAVGQLVATPSRHLHDRQQVNVRLSRFAADARVRLSECLGAAAVKPGGCGFQPAQQPFVDLDAQGAGAARFTVTAFAADAHGRIGACRSRCRLVATAVSRSGRRVVATQLLRFGPGVRRLVRPESFVPARGACGRVKGPVVTVSVNPDVPILPCTEVRADQHLRVVNTSNRFGQPGKTVIVSWPPFAPRTLPVGSSTIYSRTFGSYLAHGVHDLGLSIYAGGGAEIWLRH